MTCSKCHCVGHTVRKCGAALILQDLNRNRVDVASSLLSQNRPNMALEVVPNTASTVDRLIREDEIELRDVDRDDILSDNDPEPDITDPAVQNQAVLAQVENEVIQDITEIIWSEVEIPVDDNAENSSVPKFLANPRSAGKPTIKNCQRLSVTRGKMVLYA